MAQGIGSNGVHRPGVRRLSGWPLTAAAGAGAVVLAAAVAGIASLLLAAFGPHLSATTQRQAISRALVTADGRHIVVPVSVGGCVQRSVLTATETRSRVTIVLTQFLTTGGACPASVGLGPASVVLREPLSGRSLLDGVTGRPVPYFDGRKLLRATYLPPGYRFGGYFPGVGVSWERQYDPADGKGQLLIIAQVPGRAEAGPAWPAQSQVMVRGQPATVRAGIDHALVYGREISWPASGYSFGVYTILTTSGQRPLSVAELTKIANAFRP